MAHKSGYQSTAKLRQRLEARLSLALCAMASGAKPVQSVAARSAARRVSGTSAHVRPKLPSFTACGKSKSQLGLLSPALPVASEAAQSQCGGRGRRASSNTARLLPLVKSPIRAGCALRRLQVQSKRVGPSTWGAVARVLANPSVNRTLHSLPAFGLENPSPNTVNLFRAGYLKR